MPTIALFLLGLALGVGFSWAAMEELRQRASLRHAEGAWIVLLFCGLVYGPGAGYLLSFHGDWAVSYWLSLSNLPAVWTAATVVCVGVAPFIGMAVGAPWATQRRSMNLLYLGGAAVGLCVVGGFATLPRLLVEGSTLEFHNDFGTRGIAGSALGYALLLVAVLVGVSAVWTVNALRRLPSEDAAPQHQRVRLLDRRKHK